MGAKSVGGEDELIQTIFAPLASGFSGALGLKDDCALLTPRAGEDLVLTTDAVAAGIHCFPDDDAADIAWKALAVNVSDLVAKGARPIAYLLSLAFPDRPGQAWLQRFALGLSEAQGRFGIALAGGDTDRRPGPFSITIAAVGGVPHGQMVRRSTARPGDVLFLSGTLGDSAVGLRLRRDARLATALGLDDAEVRYLVSRYLRPQPRLELAPHIRASASAAMDVSDGLIKDCARLAEASGVSAALDGRRFPFSPALRTALASDPHLFETAITGGDDYEVLAAVPPDKAIAFQAAAAASGVSVTQIGHIMDGTGVTIAGLDGAPFEPGKSGWDHFE